MKNWKQVFILPLLIFSLQFLSLQSYAGFNLGFMPLFSNLAPAVAVITWDLAPAIGVSTGWHETITLRNTGTASTNALSLNITGSGLHINYGGGGETCTGAILTPGGFCTVEIQNEDSGGQIWVEGTDGSLSTTMRVYDCPGC